MSSKYLDICQHLQTIKELYNTLDVEEKTKYMNSLFEWYIKQKDILYSENNIQQNHQNKLYKL